jgi:hypothetical protein
MLAPVLAPAVKWFMGAGLGAVSGMVAELFKARQDARDKAHELAILDRQLRLAERQAALQLADRQLAATPEAHAFALDEQRLLYGGPPPSGIRLVDLLNGLMRPVAVAAAIFVFVAIALTLVVGMAHDLGTGTLGYREAMDLFGDSVVADLVLAVWGFLFGYRNFKATRGG